MERSTWLKEKRCTTEVRYDTLHASTQALFSIIEEGEGDDYHHFIVRREQ